MGLGHMERTPAPLAGAVEMAAVAGGRRNPQCTCKSRHPHRDGWALKRQSESHWGVTLGTLSGLVARFEASWATLIFLSFFYVNVLCKLKQVVSSWLDPNLFLPLNHHHHHHHLLHWLLP